MRVLARRSLGTRRRRGLALGFASAIALVAASLTFLALTRDSALSRPADGRSPAPSVDVVAAADAIRSTAAAWIVENVARGTILACDPAACADVESRGYLPTALVPLRTDRADIRQAELVLVTSAVRARLGATLDQLVTPTPLAVFGTGETAVEVQEISLDGPDGYQQRSAADRADRVSAGRALATARGLHLGRQARGHLVQGNVDGRILTTLPPLLAAHDLWVSRFATSGPEGRGGILRVAEIDHIDGQEIREGTAETAAVVEYFRSQRPPFLPSAVEVTSGAQGLVLRVTYPAPSPLGLLGAQKD